MFLSNGLVITWRLNTPTTVHPWKATLIAAADRLTGAMAADRPARLPRVSGDWLRRYQIDSAKHSTDS
jgi:hypothetical protein